jgi:hypothetical protein
MKAPILSTAGLPPPQPGPGRMLGRRRRIHAKASCTNTIVNKEAPQVTVWAWYPAFEQVVDSFNESNDDVPGVLDQCRPGK